MRLTRRRVLRRLAGISVATVGVATTAACGGTAPVVRAPAEGPASDRTPRDRPRERGAASEQVTAAEQVEVLPDYLPPRFAEAPELAEQVAAGALPPVERRLPSQPLVYRPLRTVGVYGGTWRRGFMGPSDGQNIDRIEHDHLLFWDTQVSKVVPHLAAGWDLAADGRSITIFLRPGLRWSDGRRLTADDVMFWYEDLYLNEQLNPTKAGWNAVGGAQSVWRRIDAHTVQVEHAAPYFAFVWALASLGVAGHFTRGGSAMGVWAPKHYLGQFHAAIVGEAEANRAAALAGHPDWASHLRAKNNVKTNPECPTTAPWRPVTPIGADLMLLRRNPYFFAVDVEGQQLPYIDEIAMQRAGSLVELNERAIEGQYDFQLRHINIARVPELQASSAANGYELSFWRGLHGTDAGFFVNQNYGDKPSHDLEVSRLLRARDFRIALSLAIDRAELNDTFWLGLGDPGSAAPPPQALMGPEAEYRQLNATLDPARAGELLDTLQIPIGPAGTRQRSDGRGDVELQVTAVADAFIDWPGIAKAVARMWAADLGIRAVVAEVPRGEMSRRLAANDVQLRVWSTDGNDNPFTYPFHALAAGVGSAIGPEFGRWYDSGGTAGTPPTPGSGIERQQALYDQGKGAPDAERIELGREINRIMAREVYVIGTVGVSPALMGVRVKAVTLENVPEIAPFSTPAQTPGPARPEQWFFTSG